MTHIVVDPVTRIEGHLRIEAEIDGGQVSDAWSSSTMFRGIEIILQGRDPRDAMGVLPTDLRRLHDRPCDRFDSRSRRRDRREAASERSTSAKPHHRVAEHSGSRDPLLSPARARLGRHRVCPQSRPECDVEARAVDLAMAEVESEVLRRHPSAREGPGRSRPTRSRSPTRIGATRRTSSHLKRT